MIETKEKNVLVKVNKIICDFCGKEIMKEYYKKRCVMCRRHVCVECSGNIDDSGDYSDHTCQECWDIGAKYREAMSSLEAQIEVIEDQWIAICMENARLKSDNIKH